MCYNKEKCKSYLLFRVLCNGFEHLIHLSLSYLVCTLICGREGVLLAADDGVYGVSQGDLTAVDAGKVKAYGVIHDVHHLRGSLVLEVLCLENYLIILRKQSSVGLSCKCLGENCSALGALNVDRDTVHMHTVLDPGVVVFLRLGHFGSGKDTVFFNLTCDLSLCPIQPLAVEQSLAVDKHLADVVLRIQVAVFVLMKQLDNVIDNVAHLFLIKRDSGSAVGVKRDYLFAGGYNVLAGGICVVHHYDAKAVGGIQNRVTVKVAIRV